MEQPENHLTCQWCSSVFPQKTKGRPSAFCSRPCRDKSWRDANKEKCIEKAKNRDKVARNVAAALYREANREKVNAAVRAWAKRNPEKKIAHNVARRARLAGAESFLISVKELGRITRSLCAYCGQPGGTLDHVIPLARGGRHSVGNLVGACGACNSSKKDSTVMEWRIRLLRVAAARA